MRERSLGVLVLGLALALMGPGAGAAEPQSVPPEAQRRLVLTVYQDDLALVHDTRWVALMVGENRLSVLGASPRIRPETLTLSATDRKLRLTSQSYLPADLSPQRLLRDAVGGKVLLIRSNPETGADIVEEAELLSLVEGPVLRLNGHIEIAPPGRIALKELPEGLSAEPSLLLVLESSEAGAGEITLSYLTGGLAWQADYVATLNETGERLTLTGNVTLNNRTAAAFHDAELRLVAGEVARAAPPEGPPGPRPVLRGTEALSMAAAALPPPAARAERYLYDTGRKVDLAPGESRQLTLFRAEDLPVARHLRFPGLAKVDGPEEVGPEQAVVTLAFRNPAGEGARPLPAGILRVYDSSAGGLPIFAGEGRIDHRPAGEEVRVDLGAAFDVTARARRVSYERISDRSYESGQQIQLRNAKPEAVTVEVEGRFPGDWKMLEESAPHEAVTASEVVWRLNLPPESETELTYRVRVSW